MVPLSVWLTFGCSNRLAPPLAAPPAETTKQTATPAKQPPAEWRTMKSEEMKFELEALSNQQPVAVVVEEGVRRWTLEGAFDTQVKVWVQEDEVAKEKEYDEGWVQGRVYGRQHYYQTTAVPTSSWPHQNPDDANRRIVFVARGRSWILGAMMHGRRRYELTYSWPTGFKDGAGMAERTFGSFRPVDDPGVGPSEATTP